MKYNRNHTIKHSLILMLLCSFICILLCACSLEEASPTTAMQLESSATECDATQTNATSSDVTASDATEMDADVLDISMIPAYYGNPYIEVNDNKPMFSDEEKISTDAFESYSELDSLGRCGVAYANICKALMPTEERGEIGSIRPSGWHTVKYNDLIDGNYLYNRCHLIGYQLAGENSNEKNLITGTRYLNVDGMLPFENQIFEYVTATSNHVLYRVTPIYVDENLVASGVELEAWSVEDAGIGICFHVYCYNVQPGIIIDYLTGDSYRDDSIVEPSDCDYVVNTNTEKIHLPSCDSVKDMAEHNKWYYTGTLDGLTKQGYKPCKRCLIVKDL